MRNRKTAVSLCMSFLLMTAGCSNPDADLDVPTVETVNVSDGMDTKAEEITIVNSNHQNHKETVDSQQDGGEKSNHQSNNGESAANQSDNSVKNDGSSQSNNEDLAGQSNITQPQADDAQSQTDSSQSQTDNNNTQSDSELDGSIESIGDNSVVINKTFYPSANTAVSYGDSEKVLVAVYFSEETEFEVWTVKNGGVNGDDDAEKRQGAFSDLKQDANINMTGNYNGNDFHAKKVIIYNFV